jgi:hypothetical protein
MQADEVPDIIMMTRYADHDLDDSPICGLACGHFFTMETLDGLVGLKDVYELDNKTGRFVALIENFRLAAAVPQCPACQRPIRQYVTQRYNRLINRAVIDEMAKRFIVSGQQELRSLEDALVSLSRELEKSRPSTIPTVNILPGKPDAAKHIVERATKETNGKLSTRYIKITKLEKDIMSFQRRMATQHQPANKLHNAIVHSVTNDSSLDSAMAKMTLSSAATSAERDSDERIRFGGLVLQIKAQCLIIEDKFEIASSAKEKFLGETASLRFSGGAPGPLSTLYLKTCKALFEMCDKESLPKLAVEVALYYSRVARLLVSSGLMKAEDVSKAQQYRETAKQLLKKAAKLCEQPFKDAKKLAQAVEKSEELLGKEFYAEVTKEEIEAIKKAMVSGAGGIATHSGHWYKCVNGHPVSFYIFHSENLADR